MQRAKFLFWLDVILLLAVAPLQGPRTTGLAGHEWLGIAFALLLVLHVLLNWRWIAKTLRRLVRDTRRARVNAALNGALYLAMVLTVYSGIEISQIVRPLVGAAPSALRAWRQLHDMTAMFGLIIVGLHVALNWDWIVNVVQKWRQPRAVEAGRSFAERLGLDGFGSTVRRLVMLALVTGAVSGVSYVWVRSSATQGLVRKSSRARPADLAHAPIEIAGQLLLVAGVALVGRRVLRLKL